MAFSCVIMSIMEKPTVVTSEELARNLRVSALQLSREWGIGFHFLLANIQKSHTEEIQGIDRGEYSEPGQNYPHQLTGNT